MGKIIRPLQEPNLQDHLVTARYNSALPIASDVTNFDHTQILNILHFPGNKDAQKLIEEGLLWRSKNGFIGEYCLSYFYSKFAKLATLLGITSERREVYDKLLNISAFWDVCPVIASNKCGGSHNNRTFKIL